MTHEKCEPGMCVEPLDEECPNFPNARIWDCPECGLQIELWVDVPRMVHVACPRAMAVSALNGSVEMRRIGL